MKDPNSTKKPLKQPEIKPIKSKRLKVYTQFNQPPQTPLITEDDGRVQHQFKEESDINNIVGRYRETGILGDPSLSSGKQPMFGDFSNTVSYHESRTKLIQAKEDFANLPAKVRDRFKNDPEKLIKFIDDDKNRAEAEKLGLIPRSEISKPPEPKVTTPVTPKPIPEPQPKAPIQSE